MKLRQLTDNHLARNTRAFLGHSVAYVYVIHRQGGPYLVKLSPEGRTQDRGYSFPNTDRSRPMNNIFSQENKPQVLQQIKE